MPDVKYRIISAGHVAADIYFINANVIEGSVELTTGTVQSLAINGFSVRCPAKLVRLPEGFQGQYQYKFYVNLSACAHHEREMLLNATDGILLTDEPEEWFVVKSNKHKYLLFTDGSGLFDSLSIIVALGYQGLNTEVYFEQNERTKSMKMMETFLQSMTNQIQSVGKFHDREIKRLLSGQKIGTELLLMCGWPTVMKLVKWAKEAGFTEDEIQLRGIGDKETNVFCIKCYRIVTKSVREERMACDYCGAALAVSDHYSPRLEAYLGFVDQV